MVMVGRVSRIDRARLILTLSMGSDHAAESSTSWMQPWRYSIASSIQVSTLTHYSDNDRKL